ncbi:MAG TPA: FKBP-type peptidyl-prolyl cis-trans isomerase [Planctomycetota bacterium]|nr:FKBP-type peptidyl-prolyl cis-trans isomerase [Planctomycetota bacterium]
MSRAIVLTGTLLLSAALMAGEDSPLKTDKDKISYAIGVSMGSSIKDFAEDLDIAVLANGIKDTVGGKPLMSDAQIREVLMAFQKTAMAKQGEKAKKAGEKNLKEGEEFLAANAKKEGVKVLPSGLQYKVLKEGDGPTPTANDQVTTHYRGTLLDGSEFDSSYARNEPATFPVKGVIPGWTEALQLMKVGSKWQLFIPSKLAYGEQGAGGKIGPNSTLIFEVELLGIKK